MNEQEADRLLARYLNNTATPEERLLVDNWYLEFSQKHVLTDADDFEHLNEELWEGTLQRAGIEKYKKTIRIWPRILTAASWLLGIFVCYYAFVYHPRSLPKIVAMTHDRAPGGNKAVLTLSNGKKLVLSGAKSGKLANEGNAKINQTEEGEIAYQDLSASKKTVVYNTLSTPNGGQFEVVLEDGTKVKLDASSSIRYPVAFISRQREVEITGQAYFEVAHNQQKPFIVHARNQSVEVLGTHFNINSYEDEPAIQTTLIEGRVKISSGTNSAILLPGEQAAIASPRNIIVQKVNTEAVLAWKNGYFRFNEENIVSIMRKLSRWYDIEVVYQGQIPGEEYSGTISRFKNISQVLKMLAYSRSVHFKVEGRRVTVSK